MIETQSRSGTGGLTRLSQRSVGVDGGLVPEPRHSRCAASVPMQLCPANLAVVIPSPQPAILRRIALDDGRDSLPAGLIAPHLSPGESAH